MEKKVKVLLLDDMILHLKCPGESTESVINNKRI